MSNGSYGARAEFIRKFFDHVPIKWITMLIIKVTISANSNNLVFMGVAIIAAYLADKNTKK